MSEREPPNDRSSQDPDQLRSEWEHEPMPRRRPHRGRAHRGDVDAFDPRYKSARSAALLSVFPGVGQLYVGYYLRGFAIAGGVFLLIGLSNSGGREVEGPAFFALVFAWLFGIIDAGRIAALYNHAVAGGERIELPPERIGMPRMEGSIVAGIALTTFGAIALSYTRFDISLRWLGDWWPVFPLALGAYLLGRGILEYLEAREAPTGGTSPPAVGEDPLPADSD